MNDITPGTRLLFPKYVGKECFSLLLAGTTSGILQSDVKGRIYYPDCYSYDLLNLFTHLPNTNSLELRLKDNTVTKNS